MSLITYLTRIHFADRVLEDALPEEMRRLGATRPLIVAEGDGPVGDALDRLLDSLPAFSTPTTLILTAAAPPGGVADPAECDLVIGLGGPLAIGHARSAGRHRGTVRPVIAIPTGTACIGVEPGPCDGDAPEPAMPAAVLCDPTLTLAADADRTAETGMDTLAHCVEAFVATAWNPPADGMALEGIRRAAAHLVRAVERGGDLAARRELMAAALNAALAAQKGLGGAEAMARALEGPAALAGRHGRLHAALLPAILAFNSPAIGDRFEALREALRLPAGSDVIGALAGIGTRIGLPPRLGALGAEALKAAADRAAADRASRTNPRHVTPADYLAVMQSVS